jgi:hypothetical protein
MCQFVYRVSWLIGVFLTSMLAFTDASAEQPRAPLVWVTWAGIEPDKGASAWYLRKFVRSDIRFRELPPNTVDLGEGEPFDVPQAQLRRTQRLSVYEQILARYPVDDDSAKKLGEIIHDIEINLWRPKKFPESALIEAAAVGFARDQQIDSIPLNCYIEWFESVYQQLRAAKVLSDVPDFPASCRKKS